MIEHPVPEIPARNRFILVVVAGPPSLTVKDRRLKREQPVERRNRQLPRIPVMIGPQLRIADGRIANAGRSKQD